LGVWVVAYQIFILYLFLINIKKKNKKNGLAKSKKSDKMDFSSPNLRIYV
jgi:hypothetical protein